MNFEQMIATFEMVGEANPRMRDFGLNVAVAMRRVQAAVAASERFETRSSACESRTLPQSAANGRESIEHLREIGLAHLETANALEAFLKAADLPC